MATPVQLKIWYADGTKLVCHNMRELKQAPRTGIEAVLILEDTIDGTGHHTRVILAGFDYYYWSQAKSLYGNWTDDNSKAVGEVFAGQLISDEAIAAIMAQVDADYTVEP